MIQKILTVLYGIFFSTLVIISTVIFIKSGKAEFLLTPKDATHATITRIVQDTVYGDLTHHFEFESQSITVNDSFRLSQYHIDLYSAGDSIEILHSSKKPDDFVIKEDYSYFENIMLLLFPFGFLFFIYAIIDAHFKGKNNPEKYNVKFTKFEELDLSRDFSMTLKPYFQKSEKIGFFVILTFLVILSIMYSYGVFIEGPPIDEELLENYSRAQQLPDYFRFIFMMFSIVLLNYLRLKCYPKLIVFTSDKVFIKPFWSNRTKSYLRSSVDVKLGSKFFFALPRLIINVEEKFWNYRFDNGKYAINFEVKELTSLVGDE